MVRIAHISDTHFSPIKRHFLANWEPLAAWLRALNPDLVVHTGDVTVDGADSDADLDHCADLLAGLGCPVLCVPGNHDVGDLPLPGQRQPIDDRRLARWRARFGPDWWLHDRGGWRIVGIDSLLCGSGHPDETAQDAFLDAALATDRPIALFCHKPLFLDRPDEGDTGYWSTPPAARRALIGRFAAASVRLVASGHIHRAHTGEFGGEFGGESRDEAAGGAGAIRYVWAPSAGFVADGLGGGMPGRAEVGAVIHTLSGTVADSRIVAVPGLTRFRIDDVAHQVYPPVPA